MLDSRGKCPTLSPFGLHFSKPLAVLRIGVTVSINMVFSIFSNKTEDQSFSILDNVTDCVNATGWFTVFEVSNSISTVHCDWYPTGVRPYFMFVPGKQSHLMSGKYFK